MLLIVNKVLRLHFDVRHYQALHADQTTKIQVPSNFISLDQSIGVRPHGLDQQIIYITQ